jgi:TPP-dependent pyruvate/acetoin dehydrogenase alpha subunit
MPPDLWSLYPLMLKSRLLEEAIAGLWDEGSISGEMHLGTGEEAIVAGVVSHLKEGDALALDHRGTAALVMRGVDPVLLLREMLGRPDGLCGGKGGHMHLFSKEHLSASSGIVGAAWAFPRLMSTVSMSPRCGRRPVRPSGARVRARDRRSCAPDACISKAISWASS